MADFALFVGWGEVIPGREQQATRVFGETMGFFSQLQEQGEIDSVEPVFLELHGGDLIGFFFLRGERDALSKVRASEEFIHAIRRASMVVTKVGVVAAFTGQEVHRQLNEFQKLGNDFA